MLVARQWLHWATVNVLIKCRIGSRTPQYMFCAPPAYHNLCLFLLGKKLAPLPNTQQALSANRRHDVISWLSDFREFELRIGGTRSKIKLVCFLDAATSAAGKCRRRHFGRHFCAAAVANSTLTLWCKRWVSVSYGSCSQTVPTALEMSTSLWRSRRGGGR